MLMADEKTDKALENLNKELAGVVKQTQQEAKAEPKRAAPKKRVQKKRLVIEKARRKMAIARARLVQTDSNAAITINGFDVGTVKPKEVRDFILEPVNISDATKAIAGKANISIMVTGGGSSGQAQAARSALAKAIASASGSDSVKKLYLEYDRMLLVDDVRQVEPKKYKGPKARARFQKSYR